MAHTQKTSEKRKDISINKIRGPPASANKLPTSRLSRTIKYMTIQKSQANLGSRELATLAGKKKQKANNSSLATAATVQNDLSSTRSPQLKKQRSYYRTVQQGSNTHASAAHLNATAARIRIGKDEAREKGRISRHETDVGTVRGRGEIPRKAAARPTATKTWGSGEERKKARRRSRRAGKGCDVSYGELVARATEEIEQSQQLCQQNSEIRAGGGRRCKC